MGTKTLTGSVTLVPSGNTGLSNLTADSGYPISNGYTNTSDGTYAQLALAVSTTGYLYYTFNASDIPANATITGVTAKARVRVSNTGRVTDTKCQLFAGTTAMGSNVTFASTSSSNIVTLSTGTGWTRANLSDLRMKIGGTSSSSTSSKYIRFYGAEVEITYTYTVTTYDITISNSTGVTVTASDTAPVAGDDVTITADTLDGIAVTDNGTNVTASFTEVQSGTEAAVIDGYTDNSTFNLSNISNAYAGADSTNYATLTLAGGNKTGTIYFSFGSSVPAGAEILSVTAQATLEYNRNNSSSGYTARCQLYSGSTAKGSATSVVTAGGTSVAKTTFTLTPGSWTSGELSSAKLYITATNNANSTQRLLYVYGATLTVSFRLANAIYVYTITSVAANHTISVTSNGNPPVITMGTPTRTIISDESGYDQSVCTFTSNLALSQWEARATKAGITPARGVGLLVESGTTLAAGATGTVTVDDEELTDGDGTYTITVYGKSTSGVWSA